MGLSAEGSSQKQLGELSPKASFCRGKVEMGAKNWVLISRGMDKEEQNFNDWEQRFTGDRRLLGFSSFSTYLMKYFILFCLFTCHL